MPVNLLEIQTKPSGQKFESLDIDININEPKPAEYPERLLIDSEVVGHSSLENQLEFYNWAAQGLFLQDKTILDMGCGRGDFNNFLNTSIYTNNIYRYIGIDNNKMLIDIGKIKYPGIELYNEDWISFTPSTNIDWTFNILGISYDTTIGNTKAERLEYLNSVIQKSYDIASEGCVFILLSDNNGIDEYINFEISDVCNLVKQYSFGIDNTLTNNTFKLVIFKQTEV